MKKISLNTEKLKLNSKNELYIDNCKIHLYHQQEDSVNTNRLNIQTDNSNCLELLPSKGLSIAQIYYKNKPVLWDAPIEQSDVNTLDLWSDEIAINGNPAKGFTFLKTFSSGIEFYGLLNWGMPRQDGEIIHPVHGETSNIPVHKVDIYIEKSKIEVIAKYDYRTFNGNKDSLWYNRGDALYSVTKKITISREKTEVTEKVFIKNISNRVLTPDWGYHVTLHPEENSKLLIGSKTIMDRLKNTISNDFETWHNAKFQNARTETGIVHKKLKKYKKREYKNVCRALQIKPNVSGSILIEFPPTPYFQTWFCNGGANSTEFTYTDTGKPVFTKNWDGQGIEFGSSALDHNGNTDKTVPLPKPLKPNEKMEIEIKIEWINKKLTEEYIWEINKYNLNRKVEAEY